MNVQRLYRRFAALTAAAVLALSGCGAPDITEPMGVSRASSLIPSVLQAERSAIAPSMAAHNVSLACFMVLPG